MPHARPNHPDTQSEIILALDTSTRTIGLALYDGFQVISEALWTSHDHHTVELAPAVAEALKKTGLAIESVKALAVALGPGSFTGLRIGLALAKGIALVRRLPILGIPTLDMLAAAQPILDIPLVAVLRAGRGRLAVARYQASAASQSKPRWHSAGKIEVFTPQALAQHIQTPTLVCGELGKEERLLLAQAPDIQLASPAQSQRRPSFLAELAWERWQAGQSDDPTSLAPIYLHYNDPIPDPVEKA